MVAMVTHLDTVPTLAASLEAAVVHRVVDTAALAISVPGENREEINSPQLLNTDDSKKLSFVQYYNFKPFSVNICQANFSILKLK